MDESKVDADKLKKEIRHRELEGSRCIATQHKNLFLLWFSSKLFFEGSVRASADTILPKKPERELLKENLRDFD
jgi:hypothetical protein